MKINTTGREELKKFIEENIAKRHLPHAATGACLDAFVDEAEYHYGETGEAYIEIESSDAAEGLTVTYAVSAAGLDMVEINE